MPAQPHAPESSGRTRLDANTVNHLTQTIALLAAGAWAVYTFVYQQQIAPAMAPPTLSVSSVLEKAGRHGDMTAIRCAVTRTNVGQSGVRVLGLTYNLSGIKERFLSGASENPGYANPLDDTGAVRRARYQLDPERQEIILQNGTLFAGAHPNGHPSELNPEESVTREMVLYADSGRFDRVRLQVNLVYARLDQPAPPLVLERGTEGLLEAHAAPSCRNRKPACTAIFTTDFTTELSLWD